MKRVRVSHIRIEIVVEGVLIVTQFIRPEKIEDLLTAKDVTMGQFLQGIVTSFYEDKEDKSGGDVA